MKGNLTLNGRGRRKRMEEGEEEEKRRRKKRRRGRAVWNRWKTNVHESRAEMEANAIWTDMGDSRLARLMPIHLQQ
jgi:hypothetical protein